MRVHITGLHTVQCSIFGEISLCLHDIVLTLTHSFVPTQSFASNTIRIKEINIKPGSSDIAFYNLIFMSLFSQVKSTTVMRRIKSRRKNPLAPHRSRRNLPNHPTLNPRSLPRINLPNRTAGRPTASHPRPLATASKVLSHHRYWEIWSWKTDGFFAKSYVNFLLKNTPKKSIYRIYCQFVVIYIQGMISGIRWYSTAPWRGIFRTRTNRFNADRYCVFWYIYFIQPPIVFIYQQRKYNQAFGSFKWQDLRNVR